jgi:hypothetical protein
LVLTAAAQVTESVRGVEVTVLTLDRTTETPIEQPDVPGGRPCTPDAGNDLAVFTFRASQALPLEQDPQLQVVDVQNQTHSVLCTRQREGENGQAEGVLVFEVPAGKPLIWLELQGVAFDVSDLPRPKPPEEKRAQAPAKEQTQEEATTEGKDKVRVGSGSGKIEGRVFRSDTNASASGVEVELVDPSAPKERQTIATAATGPKGQFSFTEVRPGTYRMVVTARYEQQEDLPCMPLPPTGPGVLLARTREGWLVAVGRTSGGFAEVVTVDEFRVAANAAVKKNVDLRCPHVGL